MFSVANEWKSYLDELNKAKLVEILKFYHELCASKNIEYEKNIEKKKKADIIKYLIEEEKNYVTYFIESLDLVDFEYLKKCVSTNKEGTKNKSFISYAIEKKIIFKKKELEIPSDLYEEIKLLINNKDILKKVTKQNELYMYALGLIIAYGVIDKTVFEKYLKPVDELWEQKLNIYYKKEYQINEKNITSKALKNKERIDKYLKNKDIKVFSKKEYILLGTHLYHHNIKSYKKYIKVLKSNYVFKRKDIEFIDKEIVTPYLYTSLNEEAIANEKLEKTIMDLFEFKNDKLKNKMIEEVKKIRNDFPLWEYRGFSKNEVK